MEVMGFIFCIMLIVGAVIAMIWLFTTVSMLNESDTNLRMRIQMIENALLTSNSPKKKEQHGKNIRRRHTRTIDV